MAAPAGGGMEPRASGSTDAYMGGGGDVLMTDGSAIAGGGCEAYESWI